MGKKEETPFQIAIKENDTLKKTIDKYIKSAESHTKKKNPDRRETTELYDRCTGHMAEIESQVQHVTELTQEDEPSMKESKFNTKKKDELKKLNSIKERLVKLKEKLKPDETEEGDMKKEHEDDEAEDDEDADEESEEDESDEEYEDEEYSDEEPLVKKSPAEAKDSARSQKSGKITTEVVKKTQKKKEIIEEEYEESEDEDFTEDDEDDMTDVTEEGERSKQQPITPRKHPQQHAAPKKPQQSDEEDEEGETDEDVDEDIDEEEDDILESEDEEEEAEDGADAPVSHRGTNRQYIAQVDFEAEQEGDLGFHEGEILTILAARTDGWLEAENSAGKKGLVPITYLKVYNKYKSLEKPVDEEEDETEEEDSEEDGDSPRSPKTPRSGRKLWDNIKQAVKETSVTDVLHAMGAVPSGFRDSTLAKLLTEEHCTMKAYLAPKLSPSCISYRDLFLDSTTNRIRMRASRLLRIVQLVSARQIPAPGTGQKGEFDEAKGLDIKSRHVRVCLFDGHSMLSNIHTMAVVSVDKDQRTWHFSTKMNDNMKSLDFGECFVRSNTTDTNIGILFELGMSYVRRSTQQAGEFSCGWVFLPLFDSDGRPAEFKTYEEFVCGGTPFEKGVDVDPSVGRRENSSMFRSLVGGNKQPQLNFRLLSPTKDQKELLDTLPDVLISSTVYIQYLSFYRHILTDTLIRDNEDLLTCDNVHNAVLTTFPAVTDQSDLMDALRQAWAEKMKTVKRAEKKDPDMMKEQFKKVFMESVYPLVHTSHLPQYKPTDPENIQSRTAVIKKLQKLNKEKKFVASLLSSDSDLKPFDVNELAFNVMGPYSVAQKHRVS